MDGNVPNGRLRLHDLEISYKSELRSAIRKFRHWEDRRIESDVVQLVLDKEGQALRGHVCELIELLRDVRGWRRAQRCQEKCAAAE